MQFNLNPKQIEAVEHKTGPLLIIAGAGTGKTATLTQRIIHIITEEWAKPSEILALTFTEKAAQEMFERVDKQMPYGYEEIWISTFHSFCDQLLRQEGHYIGLDTNYTLMSQAQSYVLFRSQIFDFPLDVLRPLGNPTSFISDILKHFSRLQDENVTPDEYINYAKKLPQKSAEQKEIYKETNELAKTFKAWRDLKIRESKVDFGDLITLAIKLFHEKPNLLEKYHEKFKYILVDEYQDTNYTQNVLVNMIATGQDLSSAAYDKVGDIEIDKKKSKEANITVVGDDDQAIYKFRGAAISNILQFNKNYPSAKKVVLVENYRSRQEILDKSYDLIKNNNPYRLEESEGINKQLRAMAEFKPPGPFRKAVQVVHTKTADDEAESIAREIMRICGVTKEEVRREIPEEPKKESFDTLGQASFFEEEEIRRNDPEVIDKEIEKGRNFKFSDIAILVRANSHTDDYVQVLKYYGIPYKFTGPKGLYYRPEVGILISFLRILSDYKDDVNLFNLLRLETFELEARDVIEVLRCSKDKRICLFTYLEEAWNVKLGDSTFEGRQAVSDLTADDITDNYLLKTFTQKGIAGITNMLQIIDNAYNEIKDGKSIGEILLSFMQKSGYLQYLEGVEGKESSTIAQDVFKLQNISKYFDTVKKYEKEIKVRNRGSISYIKDYLDYLDYAIEIGENPSLDEDVLEDFNAVNILTVHSSKGLEFPVVFMVSLVNDRFPSRNRTDRLPIPEELVKEELPEGGEKSEHLQEERRLFYVGMTRAKNRLYLTGAEYYGEGKRKKKRSIFLDDMSDDGVLYTEPELREDLTELAKMNVEVTDDLVDFDSINIKNLGNYVSYSQLSSYERCPKQYRYRYILKLPGYSNAALAFGSTIHNTLKDFYIQLKDFKYGLAGVVDQPDLDMLISLYDKNWISSGYETNHHEKLRKKEGEDILKQYYKNFFDINTDPAFLEWSFNHELEDIIVRGMIDRVDYIDSGADSGSRSSKKRNDKKSVRIIDYKTGKVRAKEGDKDFQLALYNMALERKTNYKVEEAVLLYLEHGEYVKIDVSEKVRKEAKEKVKGLVKEIRKGDFAPTPNMWICKYCDYKAICKDAAL